MHRARVATRRLRSDLLTFEPLLDPEWSRDLRVRVRWLADDLGRVRDADVMAGRLRRVLDEHPEIDAGGGAAILGLLEAQRARDRSVLIANLSGQRPIELIRSLLDAVADPVTNGKADRRAKKRLSRIVAKRWRRLRTAVVDLGAHPSDERLHATRIVVKRLRYAAEAVAPVYGKKASRVAHAAADLQEVLGVLNDAMAAEAWLAGAAQDADGPAAFVAGQLAQQLHTDSFTAGRDWRKAYERLARDRICGWLE